MPIIVYDAIGTPYIRILGPTNGTAVEGGTNLLITVLAKAPKENVRYVGGSA